MKHRARFSRLSTGVPAKGVKAVKKTGIALLIAFCFVSLFLAVKMSDPVDRDRQEDPDEEPPKEEEMAEELNVLLLGIDARSESTGRTDTIMVANVDPASGRITLVSIPRDTRVEIKGSLDRINATYVYGGIDLTREAVENLLDIEIDHYFVIDFEGFVRVVDLLDGVMIDVPQRMYYSAENIDLQPGLQVLDGEQALGFARYRYTKGGDIDRAAHQQILLKALWEKAFRLGNIVKIPQLVSIAVEYVETDMSRTEMLKLAARADNYKDMEIETATLPGEATTVEGLWYYLPDEEGLWEIARVFKKY